ncbi:hypothetical protein EC880221_2284, partial [Escherichia coli 88.0221]
QL